MEEKQRGGCRSHDMAVILGCVLRLILSPIAGECLVNQRGFFSYGKLGRRFRDCPYARQESHDVHPQSQAISAPTPLVCPNLPQGASSSTISSQHQNYFYVVPPYQE